LEVVRLLRIKKREGNEKRETIFSSAERRESLESLKAQESMRSRPELNLREQRGARLFEWDEAVEAPV